MSAPQPVLWASCGATTLAGSVLALLLIQPTAWPGVPLLLVGLTVVALATGFLATTSQRPVPARRTRPTTGRPGAAVWEDRRPGGLFEGGEKGRPQPSVEPVAAAPPPTDGSSPADSTGPAVHQVLPAGPDWWQAVTAGAGRRGPDPESSRPRAAAPAVTDPSSYLDDAVIAQCPECGSMHLDVDVREIGYVFRCRACQTPWSWRPGTPWPAVRLRPGATPTRPPARPALPEGT